MKKLTKARIQSLCIAVCIIIGIFPFATKAGNYETFDTYHQINFDNLELDNSNTQTSGTLSHSGDVGSAWLSWVKGRELNGIDVTNLGTKPEDTSLSTASTDKALQFNAVSGNTGSNYINLNIDSTKVNLYDKEKIVFSMNAFIQSYGSKGYLNVDLRYGNTSDKINNLFRFNNGGKIVTFPLDGDSTGGKSPYIARPYQQWFNIRFEFSPKARTYSVYVNGIKYDTDEGFYNESMCFAGDPNTAKTPFTDIRMQMISTDATSYADFYIDDIYFGEPLSHATEELKINKLYFSNGVTNLEYVPIDGNIIYGKADVTYSKLTQNKDFTLISALYDGDGKLQKIWQTPSNLPTPQIAANVTHTVNLSMPLSDVTLEEDSYFKLFALNSINGLSPLTETKQAGIFTTDEHAGENPTIHLVGDSLCMSYGANAFPQQGWGYYLEDYFNENITVNNWALGGRSSRSFIDEGRWNGQVLEGYKSNSTVTTGVLNVIEPGDYVFVWMGANDNNTTVDSYGYSKATTIDEYKDYLRKYADETRAAGGNIIFITSVTQAGGNNWRAQEFAENTLLTRANAMKEVSNEKQVVLLDVNGVTWDAFNAMGYQKAIDKYFMSKDTVRSLFRDTLTEQETAGKTEAEIEALIDAKVLAHPYNPIKQAPHFDLTHVTDNGADYLAQTIIDLLKISASPLKDYINENADRFAGGKIKYNLYENQKNKAVTFSFDDGKITDRDVVSVLNAYNLKGTFHLVPTWLNTNGFLTSAEISTLFNGHEVSNHGNTHSKIDNQTPWQYADDILNCKTTLSNFSGYEVNGYSYPFGGIENASTSKTTKEEVYEVLKSNNITYARAGGGAVNYFTLPSDFYQWKYQVRIGPSTSHNTTSDAFLRVQNFIAQPVADTMQILMTFAHGHEISEYGISGKEAYGWNLFNEYCEAISGNSDIWYATMEEIAEYVKCSNSIKVGRKTKTVRNPTDKSVWITLNNEAIEIKPGRVVGIN